jgi:4a-hydroxytetrahydrobiopterin dehydratase
MGAIIRTVATHTGPEFTMNPLLEPDVRTRLDTLPGWTLVDGPFIEKRWSFGDFDTAMSFINAVAAIARDLDHHPNLSNVYDQVVIRLQTHDAGGITDKDLTFAARVEALV